MGNLKINYLQFKEYIIALIYLQRHYEKSTKIDEINKTINIKCDIKYTREYIETLIRTEEDIDDKNIKLLDEDWNSLCTKFINEASFDNLKKFRKFYNFYNAPEFEVCQDLYGI